VRRRTFITLLGGAVAWPLTARAQQGAQLVRRIGILSGFAEDPLVESMLLRPLSQSNRDNGRNVQIDLRWGAGDIDRIRIMAKELVASQPEIVITIGTPATVAVQRETRTIPIVFLIVADPVGAGIVGSLVRPGGNTTGFGNPEGTFGGKLLSLLKGIAPGMRRAAAMFNPDTAPGRGLYYWARSRAPRARWLSSLSRPKCGAMPILGGSSQCSGKSKQVLCCCPIISTSLIAAR
jgi:putative ABC transport system substrate-binding protein